MDARTIDPNCLPEVMNALALAHACEFIESVTGLGTANWSYRFKSQALETLKKLTRPQIEKLINEQFTKEEYFVNIKTVHYSALFSTGNYGNERFSLVAKIGEDESAEEVIEILRQRVLAIAGPDAESVHRNIRESQQALRELEGKIKKARAEWDAVAEFLRAQGIRPDAVNMPKFSNLLPSVRSEQAEIVESEIEDEDEDEDEDN